MKTIIGIISILLLSSILRAQDPDYYRPFTEIVMEKEAYFELQREKLDEDEFLAESGEYNEYQRWYRFWKPRIAPYGTMAEYNKLLGEASATPKSLGNIDDWYELGPTDKPSASTNVSSIGGGDRGIGVINSLIVHRQNPNKLLASSAAGGLFYSEDKGQSWTNAGSDGWWRSGSYAMEFDPEDENIWYASSTIGGHYYSPPIGQGGGVYRTINAGLTWSQIADKTDFNMDPNIGADAFINSIKVDPANPSVGYIGTTMGLFRSENINDITPSNITWTKVHDDFIEDIEFKTDGSSTVFIAHKNSTGSWFISESIDGGSTWSNLPGFNFDITTKKIVIEVSDAESDKLYVVDHDSISTIREFNYASSSWNFIDTAHWTIGNGHAFCVSNFNAQYMYIFEGIRFKKSSDGGATFTNVSSYGATNHHVDIEDLVTPHNCATCGSSANDVYVTNHGGVSFSNNNVATLITRSRGLGVARITDPSSAALNPEQISLGLDHDGTVLSYGSYSPTWTPGWKTIYGGDGGFTQIDYSNSDVMWYEPQVSPFKVSLNKGVTTMNTNFPPSNDFHTEMIQNQTYPKILYTKARANGISTQYEEVYRSDNYGLAGSNTEQISDFQSLLSPNQWVWGIHPAKTNPNYLYAYVNANTPTWIGHFYRTTIALDAASTVKASWEELDLPSGGSVQAIDVRDENVAYVSKGGFPWDPALKLYKIDYTNPTTALSTMLDISGDPSTGGLPDLPINSVVLELGSNGGIYISTDIGIYYANNTTIFIGGTSTSVWTKLGTNLPNIPLGNLEINYVANKIRVTSLGRGIWEHDLFCMNTLSGNYSGAQTGTQFLEVYNEIQSVASITGNAKITYRAGTEILLNPGFIASPDVGTSGYFEGFIHPCSYIGSSPNLKDLVDENNAETNEYEREISPVVSEIKAFPNPSTGIFTISIANDLVYDVAVYNATGNEIFWVNQTRVDELNIDLSTFDSGFYFVRCISSNDLKAITLIKK